MRGARKKPHLLKIKRPVFYTRGVARCEDTMSPELEQQREHSRIMLNVLLCCSTIIGRFQYCKCLRIEIFVSII